MKIKDFFYHKILQGWDIMGNDKMMIVKHQEAMNRWKKFLDENDFRDIINYFQIALEAKILTDGQTGNILGPNDDLMWGFRTDAQGNILWDAKDAYKARWQYTFRRQPLMHVDENRVMERDILAKLKEEGLIK